MSEAKFDWFVPETCEAAPVHPGCYVPSCDVQTPGWYWWDRGHPQNPTMIRLGRKNKQTVLRRIHGDPNDGSSRYGHTVREMGGHWIHVPKPPKFAA